MERSDKVWCLHLSLYRFISFYSVTFSFSLLLNIFFTAIRLSVFQSSSLSLGYIGSLIYNFVSIPCFLMEFFFIWFSIWNKKKICYSWCVNIFFVFIWNKKKNNTNFPVRLKKKKNKKKNFCAIPHLLWTRTIWHTNPIGIFRWKCVYIYSYYIRISISTLSYKYQWHVVWYVYGVDI